MASFWSDGFMDEVDDFNDGSGEKKSWEIGRDGLILLIDATRPMFRKNSEYFEDEFTPFVKCMKCAKSVLMNKIISSDKDLLGIVLFGTEKQQNSSDFKNIFNLQELDMPDANRVLQIEALETGTVDFEQKYGHDNNFAISDALWECSNMFANSTFKLAHKRILLFTTTDEPHANDRELQKRALKKSKDLSEIGIELELLHLGNSFDVDKFYRDVINDESSSLLGNPSERFEELLTRVRMKENKKRATTRLPFNLTEGLSFSVGIYALNRQATKGQYVQVDSRSNEEVKCSTKYICFDTGQELLPTDIKLYQEFGGSKAIFEKEEVALMKNMVEPGFHLLGFKPAKYIKSYYHIKESTFIYPDEGSIIGSTSLFSALLDSCIEKKVTPICVFKSSVGGPRIVALLPQEEEIDEYNLQVKPPGFNVVFLPYSDDIRKLKIDSHAKASEEQIDKAKVIVDKLKFTYAPDMFENPSIQKFYRGLEAFALDRDDIEEFKDLTVINTNVIDRKAGSVMGEFNDLVFPAGYNAEAAAKRKAPSSTTAAPKKAKVEMVDVDVKEVAERGTLNKLTVPVLKTFCQANKIKSASQKKGDLISAINDHFMIS